MNGMDEKTPPETQVWSLINSSSASSSGLADSNWGSCLSEVDVIPESGDESTPTANRTTDVARQQAIDHGVGDEKHNSDREKTLSMNMINVSSEAGTPTCTTSMGARVFPELNRHNVMQGTPGHATSTPLLSTKKLVIPFDLTAIHGEMEDKGEENDPDLSDIPIKPKAKKKTIWSDEESEEEEDFDKENKVTNCPKESGLNSVAASTKSLESVDVHDLAQKITDLDLEQETVKKPFTFKAQPSAPIQQKQSADVIEVVSVSSDEDNDWPVLTDDDDDSPKFIRETLSEGIRQHKEAMPPRRIEPASMRTFEEAHGLKKPAEKFSIDDIHSTKIDPVKSSVASANVLAHRSSVQKMIQYLADTIQNIPTEDSRAEVPPGLKVPLYDHQSYGLEWLHWREAQFPGGGILADEMGVGKTIMMISLMLRGKVEAISAKPWSCPDMAKSRLVPSKSTLVIVPPSVMAQWESEISSKSSRLRVSVYHGPKRTSSAAVLAQYDVVLTSYNTVGSEIREDRRGGLSPLERVFWQRIILDEGHIIRNCKTKGAQAIYKLEAAHRWVVTGTPVHNRPSDMQSLIKFLRLKPFDDPEVWEHWIGLKAIKAGNMPRLNTIGKALILRRTKEEVKNVGGKVRSIPPKHVTDVQIIMGEEHRRVYDHFKNFAEEQFKLYLKEREVAAMQRAADNYVAGRNRVKNRDPQEITFSTILVLMLRLRQVSVLPYLTSQMLVGDEGEDLSCEFDPLNEADLITLKNPTFAETFISAKLAQLFQDLEEIKNKCRSEEKPMDKVIVVSQWTTLLRIVDAHLRYRGYSTATISGEVKLADRAEIVKRFNSESKRPQIMLLSLAAGGVGLNLVGGNHMIFLDVHYNPQLELQAQDRIHRFGQTKDVYIRRYVCDDSMEERVVDLQNKKLELSEGLLSSSSIKSASSAGLTLQDIRKLFEI